MLHHDDQNIDCTGESYSRSWATSRTISHGVSTTEGWAETTGETRTGQVHDTLLDRLVRLEALLTKVVKHQAKFDCCVHCGAYQSKDRCPYCGTKLRSGQTHSCSGPQTMSS